MTPEVWRHINSLGPFPWAAGTDYTYDEVQPGLFVARYRRCECPRFQPDPRFYRPVAKATA